MAARLKSCPDTACAGRRADHDIILVFSEPLTAMERRALPRRSVAISGQAQGQRGSFPCLISTLNEKGLGFVCDEHFQVGEEITIAWAFGPRESSLQVQCVVRNAEGTQVGVEFLNLRLADRMRISHFLITTAASPSK